jgi:hypothetical protein
MLDEAPPSVSGTLVRGLLEVARDVVGADTMARAFNNTPPGERTAVESALPGGWVPIASVERSFMSIADAAGRDLPGLHLELARISVERALKTFWRMLLRLTTDEALVSRTPIIFGKSYNRGRLVPTIVSPGRGEVRLIDWPEAPDWPLRGTRVGVETVLRVAGRKDVRIDMQRTPTGALYVATWR